LPFSEKISILFCSLKKSLAFNEHEELGGFAQIGIMEGWNNGVVAKKLNDLLLFYFSVFQYSIIPRARRKQKIKIFILISISCRKSERQIMGAANE
jgi:hypothetical protein